MTYDGQGKQCDAAYGKELSTTRGVYEMHIQKDGCYRVEVYSPKCEAYSPSPVDVHYCQGKRAQVTPMDTEGWVPLGVWPFFASWKAGVVHHGSHDATRLVYVNDLSEGCYWEEPRLARIHLKADFGQVEEPVVLAMSA